MTFCKVLAQAQRDADTITAYEKWEYSSAVPHYCIVISRDNIARLEFKTAKTTWKSKFKQLADIT